MKDNKFIMLVSGTGGVGKNTLINGILNNDNIEFISSYTTRQKRETDKKNQYNFITKEEFEAKIKSGEIFEYDIFNNQYYGTSKLMFSEGLKNNDVVVKDMSILGCRNLKEAMGQDYRIVTVFLTESKKVLKQRLIDRGEKPERIKNRLALYKKEQAAMINYNYAIKNTIYNLSIEKLEALMRVETNSDIIYPCKDYSKITAKKIDKFALKLEHGKTLKPIKVALIDKKIFIVDGVHRYLASLKTGKNVCKQFVEYTGEKFDFNLDEWKKIVNAYDINS